MKAFTTTICRPAVLGLTLFAAGWSQAATQADTPSPMDAVSGESTMSDSKRYNGSGRDPSASSAGTSGASQGGSSSAPTQSGAAADRGGSGSSGTASGSSSSQSGNTAAGTSGSAAGGTSASSTSGAGAQTNGGKAGGTGQAAGAGGGAGQAKKEGGKAGVFLMVPLEVVAVDAAMKRGCWVKLFDAENFGGASLTLVGPNAIADMGGPFGLNWDDKVKSLETGPKASVTVYDDEKFDDRVTQFKPAQKVPQVSKRLGFFDEFGSLRISCAK